MVQFKRSLFSLITILGLSSFISFSMKDFQPKQVNANENYLSVSEVKMLSSGEDVVMGGVVTSMLDNNLYLADSDGIGIKVNGINDTSTFHLKDKIKVSGKINIDGNNIKSINNAKLMSVISASNNVKPIYVEDINSYLVGKNVGNIIEVKDLRYWNKNKDNNYQFKINGTSDTLNLFIKENSFLSEEAHFLNKIGDLKDKVTPLIQKDDYNIKIKSLSGVINYNSTIKMDIFEQSIIDMDYRHIYNVALKMHLNNDGQCVDNFKIAQIFILNLPKSALDTFKNDSTPGIKPIRERYIAWAKYHGVDPWNPNTASEVNVQANISNNTIIILVVCIIGAMLIIGAFVLFKFTHPSKKD